VTVACCAIYARCSAQRQADRDLSIPAQLDAARARAAAEGWEVVSEYIDEAESARTADRPAFRRMIADARPKPRPFDQNIAWKFSRVARSREDSVIYRRLLEKHGVRIISLNEPVDDTPSGGMLEGILEVLDEFYALLVPIRRPSAWRVRPGEASTPATRSKGRSRFRVSDAPVRDDTARPERVRDRWAARCRSLPRRATGPGDGLPSRLRHVPGPKRAGECPA
jgi:DNA invertase Pin-like site-specific DNA recombinase